MVVEFLRVVVALVLAMPPVGATPTATTDCGVFSAVTGGCTSVDAGTDGREVDLIGEIITPGERIGVPDSGGVDVAPPGTGQPPSAGQADPQEPLRWDWTVENAPEVTLTDLASFVPAAGASFGEPAAWGLAGLETNFYSETGVQLLDGELLGQPASVRFTPVAWHWSYGDGERATTGTPGRPWGADEEFEPTPTSHRYVDSGTYTVTLTIEFTAEYRFAGMSWRGVQGIVTAAAPPLSVRIGTADTVLVERGCEAGTGPGC
jgi:hypothetical protein